MLEKALAGGPAVNVPGENNPEKRKKEHNTNGRNKKKFSNKRRLVMLILLILFSLLVIVGFLLAVVLTLQDEPTEDLNMGYTSTISADVSAKYQIQGGAEVDAGSFSFDPSKGEYLSESISFGEINLTKDNPSVTFTYLFTNKDSVPCLIILQDNALKNNITYSFVVEIEGNILEDFSLQEGILVKPGETCVISQKIDVINTNYSASYVSGDGGALLWILEEAKNSEATNV